MLRKTVLMLLVVLSVWLAGGDTGWARRFGHRRHPTGDSPTYPNATPHGGFSSSNGYYSGRSRIGDPVPVPAKPAAVK